MGCLKSIHTIVVGLVAIFLILAGLAPVVLACAAAWYISEAISPR